MHATIRAPSGSEFEVSNFELAGDEPTSEKTGGSLKNPSGQRLDGRRTARTFSFTCSSDDDYKLIHGAHELEARDSAGRRWRLFNIVDGSYDVSGDASPIP